MGNLGIREAINNSIERYINDLNGENCHSLYRLIINEAETAVITNILQRTDFNQTQAAKMLGITRNTLKKKIDDYRIEYEK